MPSGSGKKNIIDVIKEICMKLGLNVSLPTSIHPEQLVGRTIRREKSKVVDYEQIKGHLADDVVIFNEALELLRDRNQDSAISRKYLNTALDPYPCNEITKRMTDIPREHTLKYTPICNVLLFFQPLPVSCELVSVGLFRRMLPIYPKIREVTSDNLEKYSERYSAKLKENVRINFFPDKTIDSNITDIVSYLNEIRGHLKDKEFFVTNNAREILAEKHKELIKHGLAHSKKAYDFTQNMDFTLQDLLLKMSCIQAASEKRNIVRASDVVAAFCDLADFFKSSLDFVNEKIVGELGYEMGDLKSNEDRQFIKFLLDNRATSYEKSVITIEQAKEQISKIANLKESGAVSRYERYKKMGWITSKQVGSHSSRVWVRVENIQGIMGNVGNIALTQAEGK